jgi:enoyl-CoA hydratase/carnithine racemase
MTAAIPASSSDGVEESARVTAGPQLRVEGDGPVRHLILARPERHNAQTPALWAQLAVEGRALAADPGVRCLVIRGEGRSFSSGIDLDEIRHPEGFIRRLAAHPAGDPDPMLPDIAVAQDAFRWIPGAPFLVIAAVTGAALGAGCQLALACDIRIVADTARLGLREVRHGLIPDMGATSTLPRLIGRERALDLILTGRELTGTEAVAMGLALRACPEDMVATAAHEYAGTVAGVPRPGIAYVKAAVDQADPGESLRLAGLGQAACIRHAVLPG